LGWEYFPFKANNEWFTDECEITTYRLEELLGTKLRALYQRKKDRDLFDLYYAHQNTIVDWDQVFHCYQEYMKFIVGKPPTSKQFLLNLEEKKTSELFRGDMEGLLRADVEYDQKRAFEWALIDLFPRL